MLKKYYAALKPERTFFNVMTTGAGFVFACQWQVNWMLLLYTLLGTTLVVMSACAVNNCTDGKLDAKMPRTKKRATATGEVSVYKLACIAVVFGLVGFAILAAQVNWLTTVLGAIAYVDYVVLYSWSKRHTPWSTLIGTLSGSLPLVAGYTAVTSSFDITALLLGLVMLFWQMVHFYAIAIFRRKDYAAGNIPVWAVRYGVKSTQKWILFYTLLYLITVIQLTYFASMGWVFLVITGGMGAYWLYRGIKGFHAETAEAWARGMFGFSLVLLLVLSAAIAAVPKLV